MAIHVVREMLDTVGRMAYAGRRLLLGQSTTDPKAGVAIQVDEADGALHTKTVSGSTTISTGAAGAALALDSTVGSVKTATEKAATEITVGQGAPARPFLPRTSGATPTQQQGVPGRMPLDYTFTIAAGKTIQVHPKRAGASFSVATAGAAAVSASGLAVVLTSKSDDTTTVAAMQALIAASPAVAALLSISGTALDTFDHLLVLADTPLWYEGTIPANLICALGPDGYVWPVELDATGGIKTSDSSIGGGEDLPNKTQVTEERWALGSGGILAASGTAHNVPGRIACLVVSETGGANPVTCYLRDGGAGGTVKTPTFYVAAGQSKEIWFSLPAGTDVYATIAGAGTPSVAVYMHAGA